MGRTRRAARLLGWWTQRALLLLLVLGSSAAPFAQPDVAQATNPEVAFSVGKQGADSGQAIGTDASGNVYVAGTFAISADLDPGSGTSTVTSAGSDDVFVAKYTPTGEFVWGKSYGSAGADAPTGLAVDATGVYVVG